MLFDDIRLTHVQQISLRIFISLYDTLHMIFASIILYEYDKMKTITTISVITLIVCCSIIIIEVSVRLCILSKYYTENEKKILVVFFVISIIAEITSLTSYTEIWNLGVAGRGYIIMNMIPLCFVALCIFSQIFIIETPRHYFCCFEHTECPKN